MNVFSRFNQIYRSDFTRQMAGSILAQVCLSAANFTIGILLIRNASKTEYGLYVVCFTIIQIFLSIQNAFANSPMMVLMGSKNLIEKDRFLSGLFWGQWFFLVPALVVFGGAALLYNDQTNDVDARIPIFVTCIAAAGSCLREFPRVCEFFKLNIKNVLIVDLSYVAICVGSMLVLGLFSMINTSGTLIVLASGSLLSAIIGYDLGGRKYELKRGYIGKALNESWHISKWALFGVAVTNVQSYAYLFIVSYMVDFHDTADISAARLFFMPFGLIVASSQRLILSKGAHAIEEGMRPFRRMLAVFLMLFTAAWIVYFLSVIVVEGFLIRHVFTQKYENISAYIVIWGGAFFINSLAFLLSQALQVLKQFKSLSLNNAVSASIMVICCLAMTRLLGPIGSLIALAVGDLVFIALLGPRFLGLLRRSTQSEPAINRLKSLTPSG